MNDTDLNIDALHRMWASFEYGEPGFFGYVSRSRRERNGYVPRSPDTGPRGCRWGDPSGQADVLSGEVQS